MKVMKVVNVVIVGGLLAILTLVLIKSFSYGCFRNDAAKRAGPSFNQSNLITTDRLNSLTGALLVDLSDKGDLMRNHSSSINIPSSSLFDKANQKTLRRHKGSIILVSDDPALSARIWMLLSQMGFTDLFILSDSTDNEVLKYKFRPDSLTGPEL